MSAHPQFRPPAARYHAIATYRGNRRTRRAIAAVGRLLAESVRLDAAGEIDAAQAIRHLCRVSWARYDQRARESVRRGSMLAMLDADECECCSRRVRVGPGEAGTAVSIGGGYAALCPACVRNAEVPEIAFAGPRGVLP